MSRSIRGQHPRCGERLRSRSELTELMPTVRCSPKVVTELDSTFGEENGDALLGPIAEYSGGAARSELGHAEVVSTIPWSRCGRLPFDALAVLGSCGSRPGPGRRQRGDLGDLVHVMSCVDNKIICARLQVTTDPLRDARSATPDFLVVIDVSDPHTLCHHYRVTHAAPVALTHCRSRQGEPSRARH